MRTKDKGLSIQVELDQVAFISALFYMSFSPASYQSVAHSLDRRVLSSPNGRGSCATVASWPLT